jgi:hypothetical protein
VNVVLTAPRSLDELEQNLGVVKLPAMSNRSEINGSASAIWFTAREKERLRPAGRKVFCSTLWSLAGSGYDFPFSGCSHRSYLRVKPLACFYMQLTNIISSGEIGLEFLGRDGLIHA